MTLSKQSVERLLRVAEVLEALPKKQRFSLVGWTTTITLECGTVACAIGYAAHDPWFNRRGLKIDADFLPVYRGIRGFYAVDVFFQIDSNHSWHLFNQSCYKHGTRQDVIRRIRKFVKNDGAV